TARHGAAAVPVAAPGVRNRENIPMRSACMTPLLLGLTAGGLFAQTPVEVPAAQVPAIDVGQPGGSRCLASQLIGCKISNSQDQDLGQILEIVLDDRNEHVAYAVVSFG